MHQKELLYGFMTPREHLLFHAIARMSRTHTSKQMHERVEEVRSPLLSSLLFVLHALLSLWAAFRSGLIYAYAHSFQPTPIPFQVLREVKLEKCADTIVGGTDPIYMKKGISGGERKRLCIAAELLLAPQLIFLDEPTSGKQCVCGMALWWMMMRMRGATHVRAMLTNALA